jgi:tRNA A37 threonylcarbamoyladenosine biosynthesis protein TsaE
MADGDELKALEFEDLIKNKQVVSIEWAERVSDEIRKFDDEAVIVWINIKYGKGETERLIGWGNL